MYQILSRYLIWQFEWEPSRFQGYIQIHTDIKYVPDKRVSSEREFYTISADEFECKINDKDVWANTVADNLIAYFSNEINWTQWTHWTLTQMCLNVVFIDLIVMLFNYLPLILRLLNSNDYFCNILFILLKSFQQLD
jgi:hypothetical protein